MNIKQAKQEIFNTLKAYLTRDALGNYLIPTVRQRPVLLMGPPGVGKTQIMEQIAAEAGVGLVAYTITHHTRQSAIGLPRLVEREVDGKSVCVTEYTLSEIVAEVWRAMEESGKERGARQKYKYNFFHSFTYALSKMPMRYFPISTEYCS